MENSSYSQLPPYDNFESLYKSAKDIEQLPRRYIGFIETLEESELNSSPMIFIRFDCLSIEDAIRLSEIQLVSDEEFSKFPFIHIECWALISKWHMYFWQNDKLRSSMKEDSMMVIETVEEKKGIIAHEFYNGISQENRFVIQRVSATPQERKVMSILRRIFDLEQEYSAELKVNLESVLSNNLSKVDNVVVCNVGQGNLNFLTTSNLPSLYFDLGGGTGMHQGTYKTTINTCKSNSPLVVLSHWDMDHIETAIRDVSNCSLTWVVPFQKVFRTHMNLIKRINNRGKIMFWPGSLKSVKKGNIEVMKCSGTKKNDSGLALLVDLGSDKVLLPADSAYRYIKVFAKLTCLVASYHGSNSAAKNVPLANGKAWLVYSFGDPNKWKHATSFCKNAHASQGWGKGKKTKKKSIVFSTTNYVCSCAGASCNLSSVQYF